MVVFFSQFLVAQSHFVVFFGNTCYECNKSDVVEIYFTGHRAQSSLRLSQHTVELPHIIFGGKVGSYLQ